MAHPEGAGCYEAESQEGPVLKVGMWSSGQVALILQSEDQAPEQHQREKNALGGGNGRHASPPRKLGPEGGAERGIC